MQALRHIRNKPGTFVLAAILIALGIGTTATVFAVFDVLLLRRLPVRDPQNLVQVVLTLPNIARWRRSPSIPRS